jgi:hypothetical protein
MTLIFLTSFLNAINRSNKNSNRPNWNLLPHQNESAPDDGAGIRAAKQYLEIIEISASKQGLESTLDTRRSRLFIRLWLPGLNYRRVCSHSQYCRYGKWNHGKGLTQPLQSNPLLKP